MRKESTAQVVVPSILFALVLHYVFQKVFLTDLAPLWLLLVLGTQALLLTAWAFERLTGAFAVTGAALAALVIDLLAAVRSAVHSGTFTSPGFMGAALSSLLIVAALYTSYHLATSPGYWFAHRVSYSPPSGPEGAGRPAPVEKTPPVSAAPTAQNPRTVAVHDSQAPGVKRMDTVFRIHHARTGELIHTFPCEQAGQSVNIRILKGLLVDYDPDTIGIVQVSWMEERAVDIHVEAELKGAGRDHYKLLDLEE